MHPRHRIAALAVALACAAGVAQAQQHDHAAMPAKPAAAAAENEDRSTMDHGAMDHAGMDHAGANDSGMDHSSIDHSSMDHSGMNHADMDHSSMDHSQRKSDAPQVPRTPIPPITDADREAAKPPAHGHHHGDGVFSYLLFDRLEVWDADSDAGQAWEAQGWIGTDRHRLWLRSEGEREGGHTESADVEVLYGRPVARWWDLVAGVRHDIAPGNGESFAAIGVMGMAPQKFEIEATVYLGASGQTAARVEAEYELLLTNRLILQPVVEVEWHGKRDAARGIGSGLGTVEAGLRLRYEFTRRFAPYVGLVHERSFGATADFMRDEGEATRDTRVVAGVRFWF